jgi:translocation and assembly module TamB
MQLSQGEVYGQSVGQISSAFTIDREHFGLTDFRSNHGKADIAGKGSYDWITQAFTASVQGSNFDLASFPELQRTRIPVEGRLDFSAQGSGTVQAPSVNATVHLSDLTFDHERAGNFTLHASTTGPDVTLTGRSDFEHASLSIDGTIHTRNDWPADIRFSLDEFDVDSLLMTYLRERATGHSAVAGDVRVRGPLRNVRQVSVEANLTSLFAEVNHVKVRNDGPLELTLANQELKVRQFRLVGEGTDLSLAGQVELAGNQALNFHSQGHLNLQLIQTLDSDFTSAGNVLVDAAVDGTVANPALHGKLQISKGSIAYIDLPSALSDINGTVAFTQNRAEIVDLSARIGGGLINLTGYANSYQGNLSFDLGAQAHEVRLRYPPGVSSTADLSLHFAGNAASSTLSGDITVTKLALTPGFDFGSYFESTQQGASLPQTDPLLNRIHLDVHVATLPELQMQTAVIRLSGDADLHLRGTAARPVLLGRADVIEGEVNFNGTKYRLERGDILFTNPVSTTPVLDLQASTRVRDYDITLNVNGEVEKPNITYRSEPPLATADIIGLLAFGQTEDQAAQLQGTGQSALAQEASGAILTEALNAAVGNRVQKLFGVSRIKIDPQGLVTSTSPTQTGPAVTIEQQVKDNLTMTYSTSISQASQQIIQLEYNLTRNLSLVGIRDQNGVVSFVMKFRQRKN